MVEVDIGEAWTDTSCETVSICLLGLPPRWRHSDYRFIILSLKYKLVKMLGMGLFSQSTSIYDRSSGNSTVSVKRNLAVL